MNKSIILYVFMILRVVFADNDSNEQKEQRILTFNQNKDVNLSKKWQNQRLWNAAGEGSLSDVSSLITSGANPNWANQAKEGMVALHQAAKFNHAEVAKVLLDHGAIADLHDFGNRTPLAEAAFYGSTDVINILINNGADINLPIPSGLRPLMRAIIRGHFDSAEALINAHANLEYRDFNGKTALHLSVEYNEPSIAQLLLQAGADKSKQDNQQLTPEALANSLGLTYMANIIANYTGTTIRITTVMSTLPHLATTAKTVNPLIKFPTDPPVITTKTSKTVSQTEKPIVTSKTTELFISSSTDQEIRSAASDSSIPIIVGSIISTLLLIGLLAVVFIYIKNRNNTNHEEPRLGEQPSQLTEVSMGSCRDSINSLYDSVEQQAPDCDSHNDSKNTNNGSILTKEKIEFNFI